MLGRKREVERGVWVSDHLCTFTVSSSKNKNQGMSKCYLERIKKYQTHTEFSSHYHVFLKMHLD